MGPVAALRSCLRQFFRWRGRARRAEFWWFLVIYTAGFWGLVVYAIVTGGETITEDEATPTLFYMLALTLPLLAVTSRRLHDKGLTAWLMLLGLVPFGQIALLILAALPGDEGPNGYGEDPLGRAKPEGLAYGSSRIPIVRDED